MPLGTPTSIGSAASSPAGSTITFTTSADIVSGNLAVIVVGWNANNIITVSSVSDGTNSYTRAIQIIHGTANTGLEIWYKENAAAVSSGATVTATMSGTAGGANAAISGAQVSGVALSSPLDKTGSAQGTGNQSCSTGTLSQADEAIFGASITIGSPASYTAASGFTNLSQPNTNGTWVVCDYQIVAATTTVSFAPNFASNASRNCAAVASFIADVAGQPIVKRRGGVPFTSPNAGVW